MTSGPRLTTTCWAPVTAKWTPQLRVRLQLRNSPSAPAPHGVLSLCPAHMALGRQGSDWGAPPAVGPQSEGHRSDCKGGREKPVTGRLREAGSHHPSVARTHRHTLTVMHTLTHTHILLYMWVHIPTHVHSPACMHMHTSHRYTPHTCMRTHTHTLWC